MTLEEIKAWLEANKGNSEVAAFVASLGADKTIDAAAVQAWAADTAEGQRWITSVTDKHFAKGLETWKSNHLPGLIETEVRKLNPQQETEEMRRIRELEKQLEERDAAAKRQELLNKAIKTAQDKGIPTDFVDRFLGEDEETTIKNLDDLATKLETVVQSRVDKTFKESGYTPGKGNSKAGGEIKTAKQIAEETNIRNK